MRYEQDVSSYIKRKARTSLIKNGIYTVLAESVPILATSQAVQSCTITEPVLSNTLHLSHLANTAEAK